MQMREQLSENVDAISAISKTRSNIIQQLIVKFGAISILFVLIIVMSLLSPHYLTLTNIRNILVQTATNGLLAAGMTFVILTGNIDLSVGSILTFSSVARFKLPAFIVTLATMWLLRGLSYVYTGAQAIMGLPKSFRYFANGNIGGIPNVVFFLTVVYVLGYFLLTKTKIGLYIYSIGVTKTIDSI